jgi:hypothetical protein
MVLGSRPRAISRCLALVYLEPGVTLTILLILLILLILRILLTLLTLLIRRTLLTLLIRQTLLTILAFFKILTTFVGRQSGPSRGGSRGVSVL